MRHCKSGERKKDRRTKLRGGKCVCVCVREREREREGYEREVEWGRDLTREQQMNICFGGFFLQFFREKAGGALLR